MDAVRAGDKVLSEISRTLGCLLLVSALVSSVACRRHDTAASPGLAGPGGALLRQPHVTAIDAPVLKRVVESAVEQTGYTRSYDPAYVKLDYPGGDVPRETGVCADVIVRAFRRGGVDLQKEIHEDMKDHFNAYPHRWGLTSPDPNIDHRRVPNLMAYFRRRGKELKISARPEDYQPGDVIAWDLGNDHPHIGIVSNIISDRTANYCVVHNIGGGARAEDALFSWPIIGHYRYFE